MRVGNEKANVQIEHSIKILCRINSQLVPNKKRSKTLKYWYASITCLAQVPGAITAT